MSYFRTCPRCGLHLDPGERCECETDTKSHTEKKKAAQGATNTQGGKMEHGMNLRVSIPSVSYFRGGCQG